VSFIQEDREEPFVLYIGQKAIHPDAVQLDDGSVDLTVPSRYVPAPRHLGRYEEEILPPRENVVASPAELVGKPALQRALNTKYSTEMMEEFGEDQLDPGSSLETVRRRAEMLLAVDDGLGRIVAALEDEGILDDTFILFTSDNGFFYGEHNLSLERRLPYEESIRNPLIIRFPGVVEAGERVDGLVSTVDIAPTVLEIAGVQPGDEIQGRSFVPLLMGDDRQARPSVLVEFYTYENPFPWLLDMDYRAIRTNRYKLIHWMRFPKEEELYDLQEDPFERRNLIDDPAMADILAGLREELEAEVLHALGLGG
jgi:arylsulfatase A-like enzyme